MLIAIKQQIVIEISKYDDDDFDVVEEDLVLNLKYLKDILSLIHEVSKLRKTSKTAF